MRPASASRSRAHRRSEHLFGTTVQSTDVLSRVIFGASTAIEVVLLSVAFALLIGLPLGLVSGFYGGRLDRLLLLIMDALFAFPYLLLAIVISFLLSGPVGRGIFTAAISISVVYVPQYFRVVRNHVISVREEPYVEAATALGARPRSVITRYVLTNVIQNVPVVATLNAADAILTLAALGFLGLRHPAHRCGRVGLRPAASALGRRCRDLVDGPLPGPGDRGPGDRPDPARRGHERCPESDPASRRQGEGHDPGAGASGGSPCRRPLPVAAAQERLSGAVVTERGGQPVTRRADRAAGGARSTASRRSASVTCRSGTAAAAGPVHAVDGVSFEIGRGETLGLVGESGCGKSSLARALLGLLPAAPRSAGEIWYGERNLVGASARELRQVRGPEVGLVFQEPMTRLDPLMRIRDHFRETLRAHEPDISDREVRHRALEALGGMGIPPTRYDQYPHEFSGGMRQRIMIALALVLRPTAGRSPTSRRPPWTSSSRRRSWASCATCRQTSTRRCC